MSDHPDLDSALRRIFEEDRGEPPSAEEVAALVRGELDSADEDRLMERVADHPESMDLLLDLRRFATLGSDRALPDREVAAGVEAVMAELSPRIEPAEIRWWHLAGARWAVAAMLALAILGFAWSQLRENERLRLELAAVSHQDGVAIGPVGGNPAGPGRFVGGVLPKTDVILVDLFPAGLLRGETPAQSFELPASGSHQLLTMILTPSDPSPGLAYRLAILDEEGAEKWSGPARAEGSGVVVVAIEADFFDPGRWRLRLEHPGGKDDFELEVRRGE